MPIEDAHSESFRIRMPERQHSQRNFFCTPVPFTSRDQSSLARRPDMRCPIGWLLNKREGFQSQAQCSNLNTEACPQPLDTPGHADFSEDTYRVLAAVDSAVMLIDHTKGVEARTRKLFEVCRMRELPIITFMNKLDRNGLDPLGLIDEVSETLNLQIAPMNWPIGMGKDFKGVVNLRTREAILFEGARHGTQQAEKRRVPFAEVRDIIGDKEFERLRKNSTWSKWLEILMTKKPSWRAKYPQCFGAPH